MQKRRQIKRVKIRGTARNLRSAQEVLFLVVMRRDKTLGKMTHKEEPHSWSLFCVPSCDIYEHQDGRREVRRKLKEEREDGKKTICHLLPLLPSTKSYLTFGLC